MKYKRRMHDEFFKKLYAFNRILLVSFGLWPFQLQSEVNVHLAFCIIFCYSLYIGAITRILDSFDKEPMVLLENLPPILTMITILTRHITTHSSRDNVKKIFIKMYDDWSTINDEKERQILKDAVASGKKQFYIYILGLMIFTSAVTFVTAYPALVGLLKGNFSFGYECLPVNVLFNGIDEHKYFYLIAAHVYPAIFIHILIMTATMGIYIISVQHTQGLFKIAGYQLQHCADDSFEDNINLYPNIKEDRSYMIIMEGIRKHSNAIENVRLLEDTFTLTFLVVQVSNIFLISFTSFQVITYSGMPHSVIRFSTFTVGQLYQLFFESWQGQQVLDGCEDLRLSIFKSNWYCLSMRSRVLLRFVLLRSDIISEITAGKIYTLSYQSFAKIVRTAMSCFTVIKSTQ
ncbi:odorant receptor 82a-like isoform X2 [Prorops nasuta]|uniref:odorant receptor 82a-like isoform X2 n=1 Tax=Prorops nasuta TaxID=863751 RepID=UPI0034CEFE8A